MDRLTKRVGAGEAVPVADGDICIPFIRVGMCKTGVMGGVFGRWERGCNDKCALGMIIDRLAAYEDTGYMPDALPRRGEQLVKFTKRAFAEWEAYRSLGTPEELAGLVAVVRCKDCKRFYRANTGPADRYRGQDYCFTGQYDSDGYYANEYVSPDDFCSYGIRKEAALAEKEKT